MSDNPPTATLDQTDHFLPPPAETKPRSQRDEVIALLSFFVHTVDSIDRIKTDERLFWAVRAQFTTHNVYTLFEEINSKFPLDIAARSAIRQAYREIVRCVNAPPEF